ncbi:MAG: hypothetical protein ABMA26_14740 [Limisphaerales bacterium]
MQSETKAIAENESSLQMRWLRWRRMGGIVLATVVGIWLWQREPRYEGQPLGHWLSAFASLRQGLEVDKREEESAGVLQRNHGKVVPDLIRLLQKKDSVFDEPWPPRPQNDVLAEALRDQLREWRPLPNWEFRHRAAEALGFMGQQAKPALPELQRLMLQTEDYASPAAAGALARTGDEGVSLLAKTVQKGSQPQKCQACFGLLKAAKLSEEAVRALEGALTDESFEIRGFAAQTLSKFRLAPEKILPALLTFTARGKAGDWGFNNRGQPADWLSGVLRNSVGQMDEPALTKMFQEQSVGNRKLIVSLLAQDNPAQAESLQRSVENF